MYSIFAEYYDTLQQEIDYKFLADYIVKVCQKSSVTPNLLLDAGCGTGSLIFELKSSGIDCVGADISSEMLMIAREKLGNEVLLLNQSLKNLDLYGTVNVAVSTLDTLNHLKNISEVELAISKISLFLEADGLFIFDVNSLYKHKTILSNNTFVKEYESVYCVWTNEFDSKNFSVDINLDFFIRENDIYKRETENFKEIYISHEEIMRILNNYHLELVAMYNGHSFSEVTKNSERICYVAKKYNIS